MESAIRFILSHYDNIEREGLKDSPKRILKAWNELLTAEEPKLAIFDAKNYNQMISDKGINYYTFCEHHFLPFFGDVKIAYIPDKHIIGLSKLSRIVEYFSKRLNTQEYFTQNIADYLDSKLKPQGLGVLVTGRHLCKEMRGVKKNGIMTTTAFKGNFYEESIRKEFLSI
jgi:GTP cyclohydrolase I